MITQSLRLGLRDYDVKTRFLHDEQPGDALGIAGSYSGDEFAVALPFCGAKESDSFGARLCAIVGALEFPQVLARALTPLPARRLAPSGQRLAASAADHSVMLVVGRAMQ